MRAYTVHSQTADIIKRYTKEQAWIHVPRNEPLFKAAPYIEIYLEGTPRVKQITAIRVPFKELKAAMQRV